MSKYAIDKQFGICRFLKTPVMPPKLAGWMGSLMRAPKRIFKDKTVAVTPIDFQSADGATVELLLFSPHGSGDNVPCLVYCHGGGFFFGAAGYHYDLAKRYALEVGCKVAFVQYRLSPKHPFPIPVEDCYAAFVHIVQNAASLGIDRDRVAVGGDSAGGCLAAAMALMCRDRRMVKPRCQLLVYPVTDRRMITRSQTQYTDTPMWHARLSAVMWKGYLPDDTVDNVPYASPMEAESHADLPPAYVETAEFDCLHDEGVAYAAVLEKAGVTVKCHHTRGTMHGFDNMPDAPITREAVCRRIAFLKTYL